jgi:pimeloyl-ACP methyl ester carboxylesterase
MNVHVLGDSHLPVLVCVPGLMGDISDFEYYSELWKSHFHVVLPNFADAKSAAESSYSTVDETGAKRLLYETSPRVLAQYIKTTFPGRRVFFAGISLGGKITIEIAGTYPEIFAGAVLTDVGFGPLCTSPLFDFVNEVVPSINMGQPWPAVRAELTTKIPDKMLRLLVQSHIEVPNREHPLAQWRPGAFEFPKLVRGTRLEDQWHLQEKIDRPIHILKATIASGINDSDYVRMQSMSNVRLHTVEGANHFIQVYRRDVFAQAPIDYLAGANA